MYLGYCSGFSSTSGSSNILIGTNARNTGNIENVKHGSNNIMIEENSGAYYYDANSNILIGGSSGEYLSTGTNNVCIGPFADRHLGNKTGNVFIGNLAGSEE